MLAKKYPELKKPVNCAKTMSWFERWRDIQFHKNLAKVDERMLHLQWEIDAREKGLAEGRTEGLAKGLAEGKLEIARKMKTSGYSAEEIHDVTGVSVDGI